MFASEQMIGRVLGGQYRVEGLLGRGGFGAVYQACDVLLGRPVAIKVISPSMAQFGGRFRREAQVQARLRHPATVRLLTFAETDGLSYMVQELVEGRTLRAELAEGPLEPERVVMLATHLLGALAEAHGLGIIHRDLKPGNIMLVDESRGEEARLLDFGVAKVLGEAAEAAELTDSKVVLGTASYMAPEQVLRETLGPWTDLYSLGVVLYEALTGRKPFVGDFLPVMMDHVRRPPPPLPSTVPMALASAINRALAKKPVDRFPDAQAMSDALEASIGRGTAALLETHLEMVRPFETDPSVPPPARIAPVLGEDSGSLAPGEPSLEVDSAAIVSQAPQAERGAATQRGELAPTPGAGRAPRSGAPTQPLPTPGDGPPRERHIAIAVAAVLAATMIGGFWRWYAPAPPPDDAPIDQLIADDVNGPSSRPRPRARLDAQHSTTGAGGLINPPPSPTRQTREARSDTPAPVVPQRLDAAPDRRPTTTVRAARLDRALRTALGDCARCAEAERLVRRLERTHRARGRRGREAWRNRCLRPVAGSCLLASTAGD